MNWKTHLSFGVLCSLYFIYYFDFSIFLVFIGAIFSILPDIDKFGSKISKKTFPFSLIFNIIPHRTITHSILFVVLSGALVYMFGGQDVMIFAIIGIFSHLVLDSLTKGGISPLFPLKKKVRFILKNGSIFEWGLYIIFIMLDIVMLIILI